eukprot:Nk52_evm35s304 gene=Nk52_evmTU35s304
MNYIGRASKSLWPSPVKGLLDHCKQSSRALSVKGFYSIQRSGNCVFVGRKENTSGGLIASRALVGVAGRRFFSQHTSGWNEAANAWESGASDQERDNEAMELDANRVDEEQRKKKEREEKEIKVREMEKRIAFLEKLSGSHYELKVVKNADGFKIVKFLRNALAAFTYGSVMNSIRNRNVYVQCGETKKIKCLKNANYVVKTGDVIFYSREFGTADGRHLDIKRPAKAKAPEESVNELLENIIFRDDRLIAVNKPAGLAVQGGSKVKVHIDGMLEHLKFNLKEKPRLIHRLDKDTTGVLLFARTAKVAEEIGKLFADRKVGKEYLAVGLGVPKVSSGRIKVPMEAITERNGYSRMIARNDLENAVYAKYEAVKGNSFPAFTDYTVVSKTQDESACVIRCFPTTGRKHQLRVHLSQVLNTPVVGDFKYGEGVNEEVMEQLDIRPYQARKTPIHLHCYGISIPGYYAKKDLHIRCPPPRNFKNTLKKLNLSVLEDHVQYN